MKKHSANNCRGVAAVEFALIAFIMVVVLLGMLAWWHFFQAHQIVTRSLGDGARLAHSMLEVGRRSACPEGGPNVVQDRVQIDEAVNRAVSLAVEASELEALALKPVQPQVSEQPVQLHWQCTASLGTLSLSVAYELALLGGNSALVAAPLLLTEHSTVHFKP